MALLPEQLKEVLLKSGFVSEKDFAAAAKTAEELGKPIAEILVFRGLISDEALGQLLAEHMGVPYVGLKNKTIPLEVLEKIPENLARTHRMIPFGMKEKQLEVGMEDPTDFEALELARRHSKCKVVPYYASWQDISQALLQYKKGIREEFEEIITQNVKKTGSVKEEEAAKAATDLPVIKILDTILEYAIAEQASDVHLEVLQEDLVVRFRIDGRLRDIVKLPREVATAIVARIKILSSLKIDEHRVPQDGRFKYEYGDESLALRVSIIPGFFGENVVLRLLFESARPLSLGELGLMGRNLKLIQEGIKKPHGMILVTGPTGSGKTTTLYSILNILNDVAVKICTVEDPVEYGIHRINQIQVNTATGLTFAVGLRALLRHDPDIIMVGEIRDRETVEMGIHAALTGHLVLSTLHTNDAAGAIPRFLDMGAEGFLVASTVNLVMAQRLVRKLCQSCIKRQEADAATQKLLKKYRPRAKSTEVFRSEGCDECGHTGYRGRIGIFEVLEVTPDMRELVVGKVSGAEVMKLAQKQGMEGMLEDGLDKVFSGLTTIEEVLRAVRD
jgi:type IV pilus assembly protein PilB